MVAIDNTIVRKYHAQINSDINDIAANHTQRVLSNTDFSNHLYSMLTKKYYWRHWQVIAAGTYGQDNLINHACDYNQQNKNGRSISVASVDKTKKAMDKSHLSATVLGLSLYRKVISHANQQRHFYCTDARHGYDGLSDLARNHCTTYAAVGVYCTQRIDIHLHAPAARLYSYTAQGPYRVYFFG